jgi:hypothetical protein
MKRNLLSIAALSFLATVFVGCSSNGVSSSDVTSLINGPSSIKGTISGTMKDNTPFSFTYDYHVTTNDGNSYAESWVENSDNTYAGDTVLYVWQYFFNDSHGYADYGDQWSSSGKYVVLEMYIDIAKLKQMPDDYSKGYFEGQWQNTTAAGNRFVYGITYYGYNSNPAGTMTYTNLKYDKNSQILSGTWNASVPANTTGNYLWYGNANATTFTGDFKIFVAKEIFTSVTKSSNNGGNVYRQHKTSIGGSVK